MAQPQDGPVRVAGPAEVEHADGEGQQAEHQRARAVDRTDAGRQRSGNSQLQQPLHQERADRELRERQHQDKRPVGPLRAHRVEVGRHHVARQGARSPVGRRRQRQGRFGRAGNEEVGLRFLHDLLDVDHPDRDGAVRTRLDARRGFAGLEPVAAHVALAHDPFGAAVLRRLVGTGQRAVLAPEALIVEVLDDSGDRVLLVGVHRTRVHAGGVEAVVTGGRDVLHDRQMLAPAVQQPDVAPRLVLLQPVQRVASRDARLATGAGVEVDVERVLLAGGRRRRRHEGRVAAGKGRTGVPRRVVRLREAGRGGDQLLLFQVAVHGGGHRSGRERGVARGLGRKRAGVRRCGHWHPIHQEASDAHDSFRGSTTVSPRVAGRGDRAWRAGTGATTAATAAASAGGDAFGWRQMFPSSTRVG